jgi:hypothetical protein
LNPNIDNDVGSIEMQVLDVIEDEVGDNFHNILLSFCDLHKQIMLFCFPLQTIIDILNYKFALCVLPLCIVQNFKSNVICFLQKCVKGVSTIKYIMNLFC